MSWPATYLAGRFDLDTMTTIRRDHYRTIAPLLADHSEAKPVFSYLPDNACPLVLPVFARDRDKIQQQLALSAIESYIFGLWRRPATEPARFPEIETFRRQIIGLPIHQNLSIDDLNEINQIMHNHLF